MRSWKDLEVFKSVDLNDSFVIGWKSSEESFFIDMDVSLWPGHSDYEEPKSNEYTCYKKARLLFREPKNIEGLIPIQEVAPNKVKQGEIPDYDTIESFAVGKSGFHIVGGFGDVTLSAKEWAFKIAYKLNVDSN